MSIDNSTGKTKGFYERGQAIFDRIPKNEEMSDEERLQIITAQLVLVRDNLFRGMSKSMQKLQARSINEVLELPNFTQSPQRTWVGLTDAEIWQWVKENTALTEESGIRIVRAIETKLKEKNGG